MALKFCLQYLGHMNKLAAMPIFGKNQKKKTNCSPELVADSTKFGMLHGGPKPIIVCSNDDPRMTLTYFTARSILET